MQVGESKDYTYVMDQPLLPAVEAGVHLSHWADGSDSVVCSKRLIELDDL